jgi:hypothetical protein
MSTLFRESSLMKRTREVVEQVWDPIGVEIFGDIAGEYDRWLPEIASLVGSDLDEDGLTARLRDIAEVGMGLPPDADHARVAARALIGLRRQERRSETNDEGSPNNGLSS